ncbi:MAG: sodium:solute symporter [Bacteroidota bacterium]
MSSFLISIVVACYFLVLIVISIRTSSKGANLTFFLGDRKSPWYVVAFGMIGASLSGVTFISVPGWVESSQFSYMQMVIGYLLGYVVIAYVLMPMYYRLKLTSIYTYLDQRFGSQSYTTGSSLFLLSRIIGASFRLYLVAIVLKGFVFPQLHFVWIVAITIALIWIYTFRGGIKTIIWTDTLQTAFMLIAVVVAIISIASALNLDFSGILNTVRDSEYSRIFFFDDFGSNKHFLKQFLSGAAIAIVMTGLDQDMMQKNLSCKSLKDAQKNMMSFSVVLIFVNLVFLALGALLYTFALQKGIEIPEKRDELFPMIALQSGLGTSLGLFFILGLIASAYSSADSALTALTTSFYVDILKVKEETAEKQKKTRMSIHLGMSFALLITIVVFHYINDDSVISSLFKAAGYTYGPLMGLYAFGLFVKRKVNDNWVPDICIISIILSVIIGFGGKYFGWSVGFELLIYNAFITFCGLLLISKSDVK